MDRVRIGDIAEVKGGYSFKSEKFTTEGIPVIRIGDISENGIIPDENCKYDEKFWNENEKFRINKNDILIAMSGATVGKSCINKLDEKLLLNQRVADIVVSEKAFPSYVYYNIRTPEFKKFAASQSNGSAQPNISGKQIADYKIPLPSLPEQQKIAAHLDSIQSAIDNKKQQLLQLDELVKSKFMEIFGDPVENEKNWECHKLGALGTFKNGLNFSQTEDGTEIKYLGVADFKNNFSLSNNQLGTVSSNVIPSEEYYLKNGDIVFVRSNGNKELVGRCVVVYPNLEKIIFSGFCIRFRPNENQQFNVIYLASALKTESLKSKTVGRGANVQNLNQKILTNLEIPIPPIDLQNKFAKYVQKIDSAKSIIKTQLVDLQELLDSKMDEYFGEEE